MADRIWDCGPAHSALLDWPDAPTAFLEGPDGEQLCVMERPRCPRQYLVAPVQPDGFRPHHFSGVDEPNGIAVPDDPVRAAAAVSRRVLPRLRDALAAVRHNAAVQPEPPHRPPPPQVARVVTLTWYEDGALGTPYKSVPEDARTDLYGLGFQHHPYQAAFLLPAAYGEDGRDLRLRALVHQLAQKGIGVNLRHTPTPTTAAPRPAVPIPTGPSVTAHRR
ncbi:hypothetical protein [Streptomyces kebangsaanensis]|uniref:hypothetical protein n=1 Tax=Streptomyces kebangsaanensis TaxID=864058 RepID=UPI000AEA4440|nr:hypothetical protein [Streptomyces kebangsaanensis]